MSGAGRSAMRDLRAFDAQRFAHPLFGPGDETCGAFMFMGPCGKVLAVIASAGDGWDHVSVSVVGRCPLWPEMEWIKRRFWRDDATAMQLHVPTADHINAHPYCLHIWRPWSGAIPLPPPGMVA